MCSVTLLGRLEYDAGALVAALVAGISTPKPAPSSTESVKRGDKRYARRTRRGEAKGLGNRGGSLSEGWSAWGRPFLQSPELDSNTLQPTLLFACRYSFLWPAALPIVTKGLKDRYLVTNRRIPDNLPALPNLGRSRTQESSATPSSLRFAAARAIANVVPANFGFAVSTPK